MTRKPQPRKLRCPHCQQLRPFYLIGRHIEQ